MNYQSFKVPRFQDSKIRRFQGSKIPDPKIPRFQNFEIPNYQVTLSKILEQTLTKNEFWNYKSSKCFQ